MRKLNNGGKVLIFLFAVLPFLAYSQDDSKEKGGMSIPEYITKYNGLAKEEMRRTGIPASITLAQGILESNYGNSKLSQKANNHFGIKCGSNWDGPTFIQDDDEEKECFRKYETVYQSYRDHSLFLIGKDRYAPLFKLSPTDYKAWANGLKKAGYATNPNYADLLIRLIEERNLHAFDIAPKYVPLTAEEAEELKAMDNKFFVFNGIKTVVSQPNEMAFDIASKYDISVHQLLRYNDLNEGDFIPPGSKIYLQPKKTRGYEIYHRVAQGETMHSISQFEGIKLKSLYKKNQMTWGQEPAVGETLCLKRKCSSAPKLKTDEEIKKGIQQDIQNRVGEALKQNQDKVSPPVEAGTKDTETVVQTQAEKAVEEQPQPEEKIAKQQEPPVDLNAASPGETVSSSGKQPIYHKVEPQETLYRISTKYHTTVLDIKKWNGLTSSSVSVGQILIVGYSSNLADVTSNQPRGVIQEKETTAPSAISTKKTLKYHVVAPQETLYRISTMYKVDVADLKNWNNLTTNDISIGQKLIVGYETEETVEEQPQPQDEDKQEEYKEEEPAGQQVTSEQPSGTPTYHKVQEGETLYTIAQTYMLNVEDLKRLNNLITNDIRPGQVLKLK